MDQRIVETLLSFGLSPHLKGFIFMYEMLLHTTADPACIYSQGKDLYPPVLEKLGVSYSRFERNIRHAIEKSWMIQSDNPNRKLFMYADKGIPPTNSEFIAVLTVAYLTSMYVKLVNAPADPQTPEEASLPAD